MYLTRFNVIKYYLLKDKGQYTSIRICVVLCIKRIISIKYYLLKDIRTIHIIRICKFMYLTRL